MEEDRKTEDGWKWMEKAKINPRVYLFWWRLRNKAIPTNQFLSYRRLMGHDNCTRGCNSVEDGGHLAAGCGKLKEVLEILNSWGFWIPNMNSLEDCCKWMDGKCKWMVNLYYNTVYLSLKARNLWVHENKLSSPSIIASNAVDIAAVIRNSSCINSGIENANQPGWLLNSWCPPPPDWIKVNIDTDLFKSYKVGIGEVFRDCQGRFLMAFGSSYIHWDAAELELQAILSIRSELRN
ncbi:uncharacterized protein LOC110095806 [Dendrobium catenatum]|uniref:uncharacterized protein LOC110095806 n=1 Tax=Dendrobium catenatum TaxID=906689 RepID=UPI0009F1F544|nr:uncharacterized protein LOC110095806 [Dendrobium catenatum]